VIAKITNFACKNGLDIEGFSEKTAGILFDNFGVENFSDLYLLDRDKILSLEGFKDAKTDNLFDAIEKSKTPKLANFIYALGIDNVGKKTAKDLAERFNSIEGLKSATLEELLSVEEVGEIIAKSIFDYFNNQQNVAEIDKLLSLGITPIFESAKGDGVFNGEKIVLTGTLSEFKRDEAQKIIEKLGGTVVGSVSKNTTMVLAGENAGSKLDKAKALNIKIISENDFKSLIKT
jgi:DNA ligase (NAD+)